MFYIRKGFSKHFVVGMRTWYGKATSSSEGKSIQKLVEPLSMDASDYIIVDQKHCVIFYHSKFRYYSENFINPNNSIFVC